MAPGTKGIEVLLFMRETPRRSRARLASLLLLWLLHGSRDGATAGHAARQYGAGNAAGESAAVATAAGHAAAAAAAAAAVIAAAGSRPPRAAASTRRPRGRRTCPRATC